MEIDKENRPPNNQTKNVSNSVSKLPESNVITKFSKFFYPFQKLVIDESLLLFKGRLHFKQYIPSKRHRFGVKTFVLCDCETGIVLDLLVYTGATTNIVRDNLLGLSGSLVKHLIAKYENKGHILYTDNWYSSANLAKYLHGKNIGFCGTVKRNRKHFPRFPQKVPGGTFDVKTSDNILAMRWKDKRDVLMISTIYDGKLTSIQNKKGENIMKLDALIDYTHNMRMIDKADMQVASVECVRKSIKWYKKLFFHLMDLTLLNCYNMYLVKTGNNAVPLKDFVRNIIRQLIRRYGILTAVRPGRQSSEMSDRLSAANFMERHSPSYLPATGKRQRGQRNCHVCSNTQLREQKRTSVTTWCPECKVPLCLGDCYKNYHSRKKY